MKATVTITRYCCPTCGSQNVETLDWVSVNGGELVGGDVGDDYWCPECDEHISHTEERSIVVDLCGTCSAHRWGTSIPLPGVLVTAEGLVERCDDCPVYSDDLGAAEALRAEIVRRGGHGRVAILVSGVDADGWDESAVPGASA